MCARLCALWETRDYPVMITVVALKKFTLQRHSGFSKYWYLSQGSFNKFHTMWGYCTVSDSKNNVDLGPGIRTYTGRKGQGSTHCYKRCSVSPQFCFSYDIAEIVKCSAKLQVKVVFPVFHRSLSSYITLTNYQNH